MKFEKSMFWMLLVFFAIVSLVYGLWSSWEPVGTAALALCAGLAGMIAFYLRLVSKRITPRPEDDLHGEIAEGAGDQGVFAPWSWWPLALGGGIAVGFAGLALGWWLFGIGLFLALLALAGWVMEFSLGRHAH